MCVDGEWMCTLRMCHAIVKKEEEEVEKKAICSNGEAKRKDCNVCVCVNGEFMCTLRMCHAISRREEEEEGVVAVREERRIVRECSRGQTKMQECNRCVCLAGSWACTLKFC